jgi:hypothetical protein
MKTFASLVLFVVFPVLLFAEPGGWNGKTIPYSIRDIDPGSARLQKILMHVNATRSVLFLRDAKKLSLPFRIIQSIKDEGYLCSVDGRSVLLRDIPADRAFADGDTLTLPVKATGETFSYVNTRGSKSTVHVLSVLREPDPITEEELIARLKAGEKFVMTTGEKNTACFYCNGSGKGDMKKGHIRCPDCYGGGITHDPVFFRVVW